MVSENTPKSEIGKISGQNWETSPMNSPKAFGELKKPLQKEEEERKKKETERRNKSRLERDVTNKDILKRYRLTYHYQSKKEGRLRIYRIIFLKIN